MQQTTTEPQIEPFRFSVVEEDERQMIIEISQEDYENDLAAGIPEDELLKPGKHTFRRRGRIATKESLRPQNIKVDVMVKLDLDVLNYFKERANEANAVDYKTQINALLREIMEREQQQKTADVEIRLLQNKDFIRALAQELKKVA